MLDHLVERKVNHWDTVIRELTAKTLYKLTVREPDYMVCVVLPKLFEMTTSIEINQRHGTVLAIGEIILRLKLLEIEIGKKFVNDSINEQANNLVMGFQRKDQFRGNIFEIVIQNYTKNTILFYCRLERRNDVPMLLRFY